MVHQASKASTGLLVLAACLVISATLVKMEPMELKVPRARADDLVFEDRKVKKEMSENRARKGLKESKVTQDSKGRAEQEASQVNADIKVVLVQQVMPDHLVYQELHHRDISTFRMKKKMFFSNEH